MVGAGQEGHEGTADDGGDDAGENPHPAVRLAAHAESDEQDKEDADGARGRVHQGGVLRVLGLGLGRVVGDGANQADGKGRNDTAGDGDEGDGEDLQPDLGVHDGLANLLPAKVAGADAGLVDTDVLEQGHLFADRQPLGLHRRIGDEQDDREANDDGQAAEGDKHNAPAGQGGGGRDVLEAVRDDAADDLAEAEAEVPERETRSLLRLGVPLAADDGEGGGDGGLEDAEEDARGEDAAVVVGGGTAGRRDAPEGHVEAEPLGGGHLLQEPD